LTAAQPSTDPSAAVPALGKIRRMTRMADEAGFIRVAAIDHPENYLALFDQDIDRVSYAEVVESKAELVEAMSQHATALLLDPVWSLGQGILSGIVPPGVGIISGVEQLSYAVGSYTGWESELAIRPGWPISKVAAVGCDGAKLVVFYRPELEDVCARQHEVISALVADCAEHEMPLIVEPIWYPLPGEDLADPAVAASRVRSIVASAATIAELGPDIMKVEFPGAIGTADEQAAAADNCAELDEGLDVPWVLLSAGVKFEGFVEQVRIASAAGASGFMAGRAIWGDGVGRFDEATRRAGAKTACERLDVLADIVTSTGRPFRTRPDLAATISVLGPDWHERFHG
jgi:tagatose-1,6-bisphosphate aldolase